MPQAHAGCGSQAESPRKARQRAADAMQSASLLHRRAERLVDGSRCTTSCQGSHEGQTLYVVLEGATDPRYSVFSPVRAILRFTGTPIHTSFTTFAEPSLLNPEKPAPTYAQLL